MSDGGEITKTRFGYFSPFVGLFGVFWFLDWKRSMKIDFI